MSIDTLRRKDNTYRAAEYIDVARAVNAGHTEHLQTERGIIAMRPYTIDAPRVRKDGTQYFPGESEGWNMLIEFYPTGHKHGDEITLRTNDKLELIRFALRHLNGTENAYEAGDITAVEANQGEREAEVLATSGNQMLVEYLMPNGTSALRIITVCGRRFIDERSVPYRNVPKKWVRAMHEQGTNLWEGRCQRSTGRVPFPTL